MSKQLFKEALGEYEKCLAIDPNNSAALSNIVLLHNNWGTYYFRHNQYQDAQAEWQTALKLNPKDNRAQNNMRFLKQTLARMGVELENPTDIAPDIGQENNGESKTTKAEEPTVVILGTHKNEENNLASDNKNNPTAASTPITSQNIKTQLPTVEEQLAQIERRIYGRSLEELPVMKRLEKLEMDSFGQISDLPILERVNKLTALYAQKPK